MSILFYFQNKQNRFLKGITLLFTKIVCLMKQYDDHFYSRNTDTVLPARNLD
jgi:hypothetical protein